MGLCDLDYNQPWEDSKSQYPPNLASPLEILVEASNGASDYGNKFGEPVVCGFTRSFGLVDMAGERREWIKPIMFSGGIGCMDAEFVKKELPEKGKKHIHVYLKPMKLNCIKFIRLTFHFYASLTISEL